MKIISNPWTLDEFISDLEALAKDYDESKYIRPEYDAFMLAASLIRELVAAREDMKVMGIAGESCAVCKNGCNRGDQFPCRFGEWCGGEKWEWRGQVKGE